MTSKPTKTICAVSDDIQTRSQTGKGSAVEFYNNGTSYRVALIKIAPGRVFEISTHGRSIRIPIAVSDELSASIKYLISRDQAPRPLDDTDIPF
jgi:hypothetical protein